VLDTGHWLLGFDASCNFEKTFSLSRLLSFAAEIHDYKYYCGAVNVIDPAQISSLHYKGAIEKILKFKVLETRTIIVV